MLMDVEVILPRMIELKMECLSNFAKNDWYDWMGIPTFGKVEIHREKKRDSTSNEVMGYKII